MPNVLVVGARPGSVGDAVVSNLVGRHGFTVHTAGVSGHEDFYLDATEEAQVKILLGDEGWDHVVCTVGANDESDFNGNDYELFASLDRMHELNYLAPMHILKSWYDHWKGQELSWKHFAVISSNSAVVPRSMSAGYCASKAALSQAMRSMARAADDGFILTTYEPGWVRDTPMSDAVVKRLAPDVPVMRGGAAILSDHLASLIANNLLLAAAGCEALNGATIRLDGGEQ